MMPIARNESAVSFTTRSIFQSFRVRSLSGISRNYTQRKCKCVLIPCIGRINLICKPCRRRLSFPRPAVAT
jgi:hypothetical protein